jgi:hypothetical protein
MIEWSDGTIGVIEQQERERCSDISGRVDAVRGQRTSRLLTR